MGPLRIEREKNRNGETGALVWFEPGQAPVFVLDRQWVGIDFDGTLARDDAPGHFDPPYPLGEPIPDMIQMVQSLIAGGIKVRIFSARACEPESIPVLQEWAEKHGLGRLEVTNSKDFDLVRFFDDRAIQVLPNEGRVARSVNGLNGCAAALPAAEGI